MGSKINFTAEQSAKIIELFQLGLGAKKIAGHFDFSSRPIRAFLKSLGLRHPEGHRNSPHKVACPIVLLPKVKTLFDGGSGPTQIGKILGITTATAREGCKTLGLSHPKGWRNTKQREQPKTKECIGCQVTMHSTYFLFTNKKGKQKAYSHCLKCRGELAVALYHSNLAKQGKTVKPKNNTPLTKEQLDRIIELFNKELTTNDIATEIGRGKHIIKDAKKMLGLNKDVAPEKERKPKSERHHQRVEEDPVYKAKYKAMTRINATISRYLKTGIAKSFMLQFLSYTIPELVAHIEKRFEPWMSWKNRGIIRKDYNHKDQSTWTWQIDHIIPQADHPYTDFSNENFKKSWALENLRPLESRTNASDGSDRNRHQKQEKNGYLPLKNE